MKLYFPHVLFSLLLYFVHQTSLSLSKALSISLQVYGRIGRNWNVLFGIEIARTRFGHGVYTFTTTNY